MIQGNTQNEEMLETSLRVLWRVYVGMHSLIKSTWQTFRQGKSCLSNLLELFEDTTATRDKGKSVLVVYLNFVGGFCIQKECPGQAHDW